MALSVFDVLSRGAAAGRFEVLTTRDDLWRLLVAITAKKVIDRYRHHGSEKRGSGKVRGHSIIGNSADHEPAGFDQFIGQDPSPTFLMMVEERHRELLNRLRDDTLRQVAQSRMEGYSNNEIAARLTISLRSVERKPRLIREEWRSALDEQDSQT